MGYGADVGGLDNIKVTASLVDNVTKPLRSMLYQTKKMTKGFGNMTKNQIKTNNAMVKMRKESMLFKKGMTSMMSSLFFFKALKQSMDGLLAPAFETVGIFDLFSTMLQVVFLPIALWVLQNVMLPIFNFFTNLPEPVKIFLGVIVGLTAAFATLAVSGIAIGIFLANIPAWLTPLLGPIGLIIVAVALLAAAWSSNFGGIRDTAKVIWDGIKKIFQGGIDYISGLATIIVGLLTLDPEVIKAGFQKVVDGITGVLGGISDVVGGVVTLVKNSINDMIYYIFGLLGKIPYIGDSFLKLRDKLGIKLSTPIVTTPKVTAPTDLTTGMSYAPGKAPTSQTSNTANNNVNVNIYTQQVDGKKIYDTINPYIRQDVAKLSCVKG